MNTVSNPYRNAFGQSPDSFQRCIASVLQEVRVEKTAKRISFRVVLAIGLITLLLAGAAYAAITRFGLLELYSSWYGGKLTEQGRSILTHKDTSLAEATFGEITVTVREAIADGRYLYMTADFSHSDPHALLLGVDEGFHDASRPDGTQRFIRTNFAAYSGEWGTEWCDYKRNEDGSLTYVLGGPCPQTGEQFKLECLVITSEQSAHDGEDEDTRTRDTFSLSVPVLPVEERLFKALEQEIGSLGLTLESITMTRTPLTLYYEIVYVIAPAATDEQRERVHDGLWIRLLDTQGEPLPDGMSLSASLDDLDDARFAVSGSLALAAIPDTVIFELYNGYTKEIYGRVEVSLK